jgi:hypothetical protein
MLKAQLRLTKVELNELYRCMSIAWFSEGFIPNGETEPLRRRIVDVKRLMLKQEREKNRA